MSPPQVPATDAVGLRLLSAPDLAREWVRLNRAGADCKSVLDEFNRRYWVEQEERAACGDVGRLYPAVRVLPGNVDRSGDVGVRCFG